MRNELRSDSRVFLSTKLATRRGFRLASASALVSIVLFLAAAPFAKWPLAQAGGFIPAYEAALVVSDLVTAALLFGQFSVLRSRALLVLSSGYLFTALIAFAHAITFPGALSPAGLLGGGSQTAAWLYMFWHGSFPLFVILYTFLKNEGREATVALGTKAGRTAKSDFTAAVGLTATFAAVILSICISIRSHDILPTLILDNHFTLALTRVVLTLWALSFLALIFLCCRRPYTVLDLWLIVVLCAWLSDIGLSAVVNGSRFDFGWYVGRIYGLLSANFLLVVLLLEGGKQYTRLARMESRYRGLLEAAPDVMVVVNENGEIVLLNVRTEEQFGYSRDELIGQKVQSIIPEGFAERLIADGRRSAAEALAQQIGTGIELYGRRKDGTQFPIEIMLSPLESAEGILITAAVRDISVRRNAEEHLAHMESRYRGLLEAAPDAMVVVNQDGGIVLLNLRAEAQFGYSRDELVGQRVGRIIPEGFAERLLADGLRSADEALAQQIGTGIELYGRRRNGSEFPIEIMLSPLESTEGILVTAAIRDITARKSAETQLLQKIAELNRSNEELEQFAYVASHDLQEPLRMVASYTQLLSRRYTGILDSDADEFIAFAVDGASRMQRLIQDLLAYSRVGTKGRELLDTSSNEALEQALMNLRGAIQQSGAQVTHDPLPIVLADRTQLTQLFQNLIGNAIKYQNPGIPLVHISAVKNGSRKWLFSVKDNGLGIDPKYFDRIFGMFQRLHKRDEFAGTGIGLAICKKIVERHGGRIWVDSQPEQGSTFRFALAEGETRA